MSKTWKDVERAVAGRLRGQRVSNRAPGEAGPDVVTTAFAVEVKHRKKLPQWIEEAMLQAESNCPSGLLPLLVLHESGRHHEADLVILRLGDFQEWFGEVKNDPRGEK
ncbi:MAG: hypothetical protein H5T69_04200 [Chloroflexi bacterium]|nr:hypothetical protein [Chloroflexota bacterium]